MDVTTPYEFIGFGGFVDYASTAGFALSRAEVVDFYSGMGGRLDALSADYFEDGVRRRKCLSWRRV